MQIHGDYISKIMQFISKPGPGVYRAATAGLRVRIFKWDICTGAACNTRICVRTDVARRKERDHEHRAPR